MTTKIETVETNGNGASTLTPADIARMFDAGYREVEILPDGHVREASRNGHDPEEEVTRTLKTKRTWY